MGKRADGEGSIYQRRDGRWVGSLRVDDQFGRRRRKYVYASRQGDARKKLEQLKRDVAAGNPVNFDDRTVADWLKWWLHEVKGESVSPRTMESYEMVVRLRLIPYLGHLRLTELRVEHVEAMRNELRKTKLSSRSVNYTRAVLRGALNEAIRRGYLGRNPAALSAPVKERTFEVNPFNRAEVKRLFDGMRGHPLEALIIVAVSMGLRQGEALALRWDDVDLERGVLQVRHTLQRRDGAWHFDQPKTSKSRRSLEMPAFTVEALRAHRMRQLETRLLAGSAWEDWNLVFPSTCGTPLNNSNVTHRFKALLQQLSLRPQRFHDLRHCCATLLLAKHVPMRVVTEILGHSQITLTADLYSHVLSEVQRDAAQHMDELLRATA